MIDVTAIDRDFREIGNIDRGTMIQQGFRRGRQISSSL